MAAISLRDLDHAADMHDDPSTRDTPRRLVGVLGEGGTARVYLSRDEKTGRPVAVKRLHPELANTPHLRDRLLAEADIARSVRHDHVVNVLDVVSDPDGESYFVMEHLAGEPISARLAREGALPLSDTLIIGVQVAGALDAIHRRGILHRDLKTENVLVSLDQAGRLRAKLIDFGVAEILGDPQGSLIAPGVIGTPESMAPEQAIGRAIDLRCDIYSFGVLLYEMVTGGAPFRGDNVPLLLERVVNEAPLPPSQAPGAARQYIPPDLEDLILECLAKDPAGRPQSMRDVRERLRAIGLAYVQLSLAVDRAVDAPAAVPSVVIRPRPRPEAPAAAVAVAAVPVAIDEDALARGDTVLMKDDPVRTEPVNTTGTLERVWFEEGEREAAAEREIAAGWDFSSGVSWAGATYITRGSRLGRFAAAALLIAAAATGLMALLGSGYSPIDVELPWFH
jgi:tRNA A-37 threonylcarbamoyl transferase component Bud32